MILAKKDNVTKPFSPMAWDLLGANKNGWVEVTGEVSENIITKKVVKMPDTGEASTPTVQVTENIVNKADNPPVITVENTVVATVITEIKKDEDGIETNAKTEFLDFAKALLSKTTIKDYFDAVEVAYKQNDNHDTLVGLLYESLNGDIEVLKSKFSI